MSTTTLISPIELFVKILFTSAHSAKHVPNTLNLTAFNLNTETKKKLIGPNTPAIGIGDSGPSSSTSVSPFQDLSSKKT